ncbi:hypothetical protein CDAR_472331 [Caerostris darwini]|uniref:Uncharacterized protein n=1 Tax=Caerostris darwini TaxID=1538125 RepID=A0AAV4VMA6_9ARAC|nr:hypothetical protein CDAR_472331 [Caerostris darwini]
MQKTPPNPPKTSRRFHGNGAFIPVTGKSEEKKAFHNMLIDILCSVRLIHFLSEPFDKWPTWAPNETSVSRRVRNFLTFHQPHVVC